MLQTAVQGGHGPFVHKVLKDQEDDLAPMIQALSCQKAPGCWLMFLLFVNFVGSYNHTAAASHDPSEECLLLFQ